MVQLQKVLLLLVLCVLYGQGQTYLNRYRECYPSGESPQTIVRLTPMNIWYSLAVALSYRGFPELHDRFYLKRAQRVEIEYKITTWFPSSSSF